MADIDGTDMESFVVSRDDTVYECFPDVGRREDGRLLCVYRESEGHVPRGFTRLCVRESDDEGRTWGDRKVLSETVGEVERVPGWNCPRVSPLADGRMAVACDRLLWPEGRYLNRRSHVYLWWSDDESWEGPHRTRMWGIVPSRIWESAEGELLCGTHDVSPASGRLRQLLWRSKDGITWEGPVIVAERGDLNLCEGTFLRRGREVVCLMRENSGKGLPGYKAVSRDSGRTWSSPVRTPLPGCHRPVAGWWGERAFITYRCFMGGGMKNTLLMAALLDQGILSEKPRLESGRILQIDYDRSPTPDTGYSGWCLLDDGDVFIVNYIMDDAPKAQIRGYRLSSEDLVLGSWS